MLYILQYIYIKKILKQFDIFDYKTKSISILTLIYLVLDI